MLTTVKHKNSQLFQALREQIEDGSLNGGDKLPPERILAEQYDCSRVTVRNSLERLEHIGLIRKRQGSGTFVSEDVKEQRRLRSIGLVVTINGDHRDLSDYSYITKMLMDLQKDLGDNICNFNLIEKNHDEELSDCLKNHSWRQREYDGLILFTDALNDKDARFLRRNGMPFVSCVSSNGIETVSCVDINNAKGAYQAAKHLLRLGRKNIVFLNASVKSKYNADRLVGYKAALDEHGVEFKDYMCKEIFPNKHDEANQILKAMIYERQERPVDALIIYGDWATFGAVQAVVEAKLNVPDDIAVVMIDDTPWVSKALNIPMTSVKQPIEKQSERMLKNLLEMINNPKPVTVIEVLEPELVIRKSCGSNTTDLI